MRLLRFALRTKDNKLTRSDFQIFVGQDVADFSPSAWTVLRNAGQLDDRHDCQHGLLLLFSQLSSSCGKSHNSNEYLYSTIEKNPSKACAWGKPVLYLKQL